MELDIGVHTFKVQYLGSKSKWISEFKDNLVFGVSSRRARAT